MKKLTVRHKRRLVFRALKGNQRDNRKRKLRPSPFSQISLWNGEKEEKARCRQPPTKAPSLVDFEIDGASTIEFLTEMRGSLITNKNQLRENRHRDEDPWIKRRKGRRPEITSYCDFGTIEHLSIAPALVIAAVYDRAKRLTGTVPPAVNYLRWPKSAFQTFYELGFFDLIGQRHNEALQSQYEETRDTDIFNMKVISGHNANGLPECSEKISEVLNFLSADGSLAEGYIADINTAISEAMINVSKHAYPQDECEHSTNRWWITASANRVDHSITIVIYDQGASIPGTLPKKSYFESLVQHIMRHFDPQFEYSPAHRKLDHEYIAYAMKPGKSQIASPERGLGLTDMQDLINVCESGYIMIVSRSGYYRFDRATAVRKQALDGELEGTLVEWHLTLPTKEAA